MSLKRYEDSLVPALNIAGEIISIHCSTKVLNVLPQGEKDNCYKELEFNSLLLFF